VTAIEDLARRLERVEAELALHRLAHDCIGADHRDLGRWTSAWTTDAVWETSPDRRFVGIEAICAAVEDQWRTFPIMQHATANHVVDVNGVTASGRCDVVVLVQLPDRQPGRWPAGLGSCGQQCLRRRAAQPGVDVVPPNEVVARQRRTSDTRSHR
jgi:hypothetical protein